MESNVCTYYRNLHRIPELSESEYETADYLYRVLSENGYSPTRVGNTGIYADHISNDSQSWILLRADMDALPIMEAEGVCFPSEHQGVMHACGHDAHMAMLLSVACILRNENLPHNIRFLFQPAEETTTGAKKMIECGAIPNGCTAAFAMHVWPGIQYGVLTSKVGPMMASSDVFQIICCGRSVHCSIRENGADALQTIVEIVNKFPEIEMLAEGDGTILFCGSIHSGSSHNIVPDSAHLRGTLRTYSEDKRKIIMKALEMWAEEIGNKHGVQVTLNWEGGCPAVQNDAGVIQQLTRLFENFRISNSKVLAAEDFAFYQRYCPGAMLWLGLGESAPLHSNTFFVPDQILMIGTQVWCAIGRSCWSGK